MFLPNLKSRYIFALSIVAALSIAAFFINSKIIKSQAEYSTIINISGRQRMLSQRIAKLIYSSANDPQLDQDLKDLEEYLYRLSDLDSEMNKTLANKEEIRNIFFNKENPLEKRVINFIGNVRSLKTNKISKEEIYKQSNELLTYYEKLTKLYEKQGRKHSQRLYIIEIVVLISTLCLLLAEAFLIFRPLDIRLNENSQAMKNLILRLEDSNKDLESFMYAASHDLKEPVRTIMNHVSFINEELPEELSNSFHNSVSRITDRVNYLYKLNDNLLDFHKAKHHVKEKSLIDIERVVNQIVKVNVKEFTDSKFEVVTEGLPSIENDPFLVKLIFREIISNAFTYRDKQKDSYLKISYEKDGSRHVFKFEDNGQGMDYEIRHKVFNPFFSSLNKSKASVTGLGLAIVKNAVFNLKGDISLESHPYEGTIVLVKL
ncbi:MAG: type IV pili methyl-accepting chemotaxis transducer N-terminal domain-containing protein [Candidatus Caenarcaniphilales bacterium]|nr:type IV pili methyl-accepting chemotaxis transducer N-terminal domain-containing protein [Candidatus Caenarcaniphilales bacterium]